ncbi:MAG: hypothetical protein ACRERV_11560, partial [Methylococcales bacterium]
MVFRCLPLFFAPAGVKIVHVLGYAVGMNFAGTEDDDFLFWPTVLAQQLEQVFAHFWGAQFDKQLVVKIFTGVFVFIEIFLGQRFAGFDVARTGFENFSLGEHTVVDAGFAFDDFASGQITVFLRLNQGVFVDRFAKILAIVGGNFLIIGRGVVGFFQPAWRGGKADVN